ncbi:MAG: hypothetical protein SGARI_001592 [Bacillariaceae sp.]
MRELGFRTRDDNDEILAKYAVLFFDSDTEGSKMGCPTPQSYFKALTDADPLGIRRSTHSFFHCGHCDEFKSLLLVQASSCVAWEQC